MTPTTWNASEAEAVDFLRLPADERARVDALQECFSDIRAGRMGALGQAWQLAAEGPLAHLDLSAERVRKLFSAWRKGGWRALVRRYKSGATRLNPTFVQYWRALLERHQRDTTGKQAFRVLREQYHAWMAGDASQSIPGLGTTPPPPTLGRDRMPLGMSYRNLMNYQPSKAELKAARIGRKAARELAPMICRTRAGVEAGMVYIFDDSEHDNLVVYPGQPVPVRPLELGALDYGSGAKVLWGMRPALVNEDGKKDGLRESDMAMLVAALLTQSGYHPKGCTLLTERGTAAIRGELAERLERLTGGLVRVRAGSIDRRAAWLGDFLSKAKGNPRHKAALESHHNLTRNYLAAIPGQIGLDRDHSPESVEAMKKYSSKLLAIVAAMPDFPTKEALLAELNFPVFPYAKYCQLLDQVNAAINARTEHDLEGWDAAGRLTIEVSGMDQQALLQLPPAAQEVLVRQLAQVPGAIRQRRLSPWEVWTQGARGLRKLPMAMVPALLGPKYGVERKVDDRCQIHFMQDGKEYLFLAQLSTADGHEYMLKRGEKYLTFLNPLAPDALHVLAANGSYLGHCPAWQRAALGDEAALEAQYKAASKAFADVLAPVNLRARDILAQRTQDMRRNTETLATVGDRMGAVFPAAAPTKPTRTRIRSTQADEDDMLTAPAPAGRDADANFDEDFDAI